MSDHLTEERRVRREQLYKRYRRDLWSAVWVASYVMTQDEIRECVEDSLPETGRGELMAPSPSQPSGSWWTCLRCGCGNPRWGRACIHCGAEHA